MHAHFILAWLRGAQKPALLIKGCNIEAESTSKVGGALALPTKSLSFSAHWLT
jgi:hypothetical protein